MLKDWFWFKMTCISDFKILFSLLQIQLDSFFELISCYFRIFNQVEQSNEVDFFIYVKLTKLKIE
jgi:hypothetical protein